MLTLWLIVKSGIPSFTELENPNNKLASEIFDINGQVLGTYYVENRIPVSYEQLNPHLIAALIATEDERFFSHSGVDFWALARVGFKTILLQKEDSGGGSTITQQLAKLLFERPSTKGKSAPVRAALLLRTKIKEWITAVKLEKLSIIHI